MLDSLDSYELSEWMVYYTLEPFGPAQEDLRAGYIACLLYNQNRKKGTKALQPEDFFPSLKKPPEEADPEAWAIALRAFTLAHGGKVLR